MARDAGSPVAVWGATCCILYIRGYVQCPVWAGAGAGASAGAGAGSGAGRKVAGAR